MGWDSEDQLQEDRIQERINCAVREARVNAFREVLSAIDDPCLHEEYKKTKHDEGFIAGVLAASDRIKALIDASENKTTT